MFLIALIRYSLFIISGLVLLFYFFFYFKAPLGLMEMAL